MESIHIDENYIEKARNQTPTELFNDHLIHRDDDPGQEIKLELQKLEKDQPQVLKETQEIINNFILDAFDENGSLFQDASCQAGTTISTIYGKLREIAFKHLLKITKNYDAKTRALAKIYFINQVDVEIFERVRQETILHYKKLLADGTIPLPAEIKSFKSLIEKYNIKEKLYQCIAEWYVEAEVSIDIVRRIQMYGLLEGKREKRILERLKKSWELKSNYYIDFQSAFLSMI
jgi:hypothetical protein